MAVPIFSGGAATIKGLIWDGDLTAPNPYKIHANTAQNATNAENATHALNADNATNAENATHALNADNATNIVKPIKIYVCNRNYNDLPSKNQEIIVCGSVETKDNTIYQDDEIIFNDVKNIICDTIDIGNADTHGIWRSNISTCKYVLSGTAGGAWAAAGYKIIWENGEEEEAILNGIAPGSTKTYEFYDKPNNQVKKFEYLPPGAGNPTTKIIRYITWQSTI